MDGTVQEIMMMKEIMKNGPVVAVLDVNADLESYKSGVYQHIHGESLGIHAVRLVYLYCCKKKHILIFMN